MIIELPDGFKVHEFKTLLAEKKPALVPYLDTAIIAINREYAFDDQIIPEDAEVAVFPPVSGGSDDHPTIILLTEDEIDLNAILSKISLASTGAACLFAGTVRQITHRDDIHITRYLEYEVYRSMAEIKIKQVIGEIRERWPDVEGIAIVQRIGRLFPGTPTVLIGCTAAHRDSGVFEAARYGIDRLKEIVPIWKKEVGPHKEDWVEGKYIPKPGE